MKLEPKKTETLTSTLEELLHAVNLLGEDRDIHVDGIDAIAVCPPVKLTPKGRERFKDALSAKVMVLYGEYSCFGTYVSDDSDKTNREAYDLLESLAGYCLDSEFSRWFEGPEATFI